MKQTGILMVALAILVIGELAIYSVSRVEKTSGVPVPSVLIAEAYVRVDVADTEASRARGLSGREGLEGNSGMLFVFPRDGYYGIWMKDMLFSIDIVWISADLEVIHMAQNVAPATYPESFAPNRPARYVLELPAGWARAYTVRIGDRVELHL
ncbi:MAG TPA: DUF192 domain-containing protein [Candidatus Paceibacterota bacterium]